MSEELNIQFSTTSLANSNEGPKGATGTLIKGLFDSEYYSNQVLNKAEIFEKGTLNALPEATFGLSILPTMMKKAELNDFERYLSAGSIDIPYIIDWFKLPKEKAQEVVERDGIGIKSMVNYGFEIAYAMMQAKNPQEFEEDLRNSVETFPSNSPITLRTCIQNASDGRVLNEMNKLSSENPNIKYALEPNSKLVSTLSEYISYIEQLRNENKSLEIGLDLDITHLKEHDGLLNILDRLEGTKNFPLMLSIEGNVLNNQNINLNTHLPLSLQDYNVVKNLGDFYTTLRLRNERMPSLIFETSPAQKGIFDNYKQFLESFKKGYEN